MKTIDIAKYVLVAYAFTTSPLTGIGFLGYILYTDKKIKELENQIRAGIQEEKILTKDLENVSIKGGASGIEGYENCVIENYQNKFYRIMKPSGEYLNKIFLSMEDAKREIDIVTPFLIKPERRRSRIYNIRYVK